MTAWARSRAKLTVGVAVAALAAAGLAACGSSGSSSGSTANSGSVKLTEEDYFTAQPANGLWAGVFGDYAKANKISISRTSIAPDTYLTKVLEQAGSGGAPNILMLDNPDLAELASTGDLVPLSSVCSIDTSNIDSAELQEATYNGQLYALPLIQASIELFYNKQLLSAAGVTPPQTWAELTTDAKKLTNAQHYGIAFAGQPTNGNAAWQFEPFLWSNGGSLTNLSATPAVQALTLWTDLVKDGSASKDTTNWDQTTIASEFASGKAAMMINGPWEVPSLNTVKGLQYGTAGIPTRVQGQTVIAPIGGEVWAITKSTPAKEKAACKVLQYMETNAVVEKDALTNWEVPVVKSVTAAVKAKQGSKMDIFYTETLHGRARTKSLGSDSLASKYPTVDTDTGQAIDTALSGAQSPQAAFTAAAAQIKGDLGK